MIFIKKKRKLININKIDEIKYIQIVTTGTGWFSSKIKIKIDAGQYNINDEKVRDEDGNEMKFNSTIDAMNFLAANGWRYKNTYNVPTPDKVIIHHLFGRI